jgi:hypothetical protein
MEKNQLTKDLAQWLKNLLTEKYGKQYSHIEVLTPDRDLKRLNHPVIRTIEGSHTWEFTPDVVGILQGSDTRIVLLNRSSSAISLKEIGEMYCYSQLANPLLAIVISPKAASSEVNGILLDKKMQKQILSYNESNQILVLGWNVNDKNVEPNSVIPLEMKEFFK